MADRQFFIPGGGVIHEEDEEEYFISGLGVITEDQAAAVAAPDEDAGLFIAGQQQPVIEPIHIIPY